MAINITKRQFSEKQIYDAYVKEHSGDYGGGSASLKIAQNSAKEFIKELRKNKAIKQNGTGIVSDRRFVPKL